MTSDEQFATATGEWVESHKPIVVAVDGSERNRSAVAWAAAEAAASGCELVLVTAVEAHALPSPPFSVRSQEEQVRDMLADAAHSVAQVVPEHLVRSEVVVGSPVQVLLDRAAGARMLVVGKRGLGGFARLIVGSTSIAVSGRAPVPVTIVPDAWEQGVRAGSPVVVGIDPYKPHHRPIHLAFSRAQRLGVPLVAVHGWEMPTVYSWDAQAVSSLACTWEEEAHAEFDKVVDTWRRHFPDVEVRAVHRHGHPAMAVLEAADDAQMVVLGRHTDRKFGGFAFGSVTRAVLHYSDCPVVVVPCETD